MPIKIHLWEYNKPKIRGGGNVRKDTVYRYSLCYLLIFIYFLYFHNIKKKGAEYTTVALFWCLQAKLTKQLVFWCVFTSMCVYTLDSLYFTPL